MLRYLKQAIKKGFLPGRVRKDAGVKGQIEGFAG